MQLILTTANNVLAGGTIPANLDFNTNSNILDYNPATNEIIFKHPGIYKVTANVVFAATAAGVNTISGRSSTSASTVAGMTASFQSTAATQVATYPIEKDVRIAPASPGTYARLNFLSSTAGTVQNVVISIEKIR